MWKFAPFLFTAHFCRDECSWEPKENLDCAELIRAFDRRHNDKVAEKRQTDGKSDKRNTDAKVSEKTGDVKTLDKRNADAKSSEKNKNESKTAVEKGKNDSKGAGDKRQSESKADKQTADAKGKEVTGTQVTKKRKPEAVLVNSTNKKVRDTFSDTDAIERIEADQRDLQPIDSNKKVRVDVIHFIKHIYVDL